jgi:DNA-binding transcriptional ArsR family regulator
LPTPTSTQTTEGLEIANSAGDCALIVQRRELAKGQAGDVLKSVVQAYQGRIHVLPSYFAAGAHLYDMAGSLYLGYSIRGDSLRSQEAERARAVAMRLKALADPTRLAMLAYLAQIPVSVSDLAAVLGVSQPTVSQHLQLLRNAGLVSQHREGNKVYYHTEPEALAEALEQTRRTILH